MFADRDTQLSDTIKIKRLEHVGVRRLTRAHLAVMDRPEVSAMGARALEAMRAAVAEQLGCEVKMQGRLLESGTSLIGSLSRTSAFALIDLTGVGARAVLEIDFPLLTALLERLAGRQGKLGAPLSLTRIEEAAFGYLVLVALAATRGLEGFHQRFAPRLLSLHAERSEVLERTNFKQRHAVAEVNASVGAATGLVRLLMPSLALQSAVHDVALGAPTAIAKEVLAAGLKARTLVGKAFLGAIELANLSAGDVVMFEGLSAANGRLFGPARLVASTFELLGAFAPNGFTCTGAEVRALPLESKMANVPDEATLPQLPVEVEVELARLRLALSELATLKPGAILPLHINAAEPVTLRVGDRAVARAELVEIEGEIGARIVALLNG
jgi:type III secretion protein Q